MGHSDFNCWLDGVPVCVRAHVVIKGVSGSVVVAVVDIIAGTAAVPFNCFFFFRVCSFFLLAKLWNARICSLRAIHKWCGKLLFPYWFVGLIVCSLVVGKQWSTPLVYFLQFHSTWFVWEKKIHFHHHFRAHQFASTILNFYSHLSRT